MNAMGQTVPNPEDYILGNNKKLIYGINLSGTNNETPPIDYHSVETLTYLKKGTKTVGFSHSVETGYEAVDFTSIPRTYKYLYYVYKGSVKALNGWGGFTNWNPRKDYPITNDGWRLCIVDISDISSYQLKFYSETTPTSYSVANIWESDYQWDPSKPTAPAADPTRNPFAVSAIYGDTYPTEYEINDWAGGNFGTVDYGESNQNEAILISITNGNGIVKNTPSAQATGMTHLHLDVWAPANTVISINFNTDQNPKTFNTEPFTVDRWQTLDIPLAGNFESISEISYIFLQTSQAGTYFDNIFLSLLSE
jgi:hypothetical protein